MKNTKKIITLIIVAIILIILLGPLQIQNKILKIIYPQKYIETISIYAKKYNIDENLILATIKSESNFNEKAVSNKGALGLMQLMEETAIDIAPQLNLSITKENVKQEMLNPEENIEVGTKCLSNLLQKYKNIELALTAYNAGAGNVDKWIEQGIIKDDGTDIENVPFQETNNYVRSILRDYEIYKNLY